MNGPEGHSTRSFSGLLGTSGHHQRSPTSTKNHDRASDKLDIEMTKHETDVRSTALVRIRPAEFFARVLSQQPGNYNAKKLLDNGSQLLRSAFGLDEVLLGADCGHSDAVSVCWETEPALTHPHYLPHNSNMEVLRYLRLQVFTVSPTDDLPYTCFETGTGPMKLCTAVISTSPQNSASVELFMGGEAPAEAPFIECPSDPKDAESLTVAVYQSDSRIAHAIIPLSEVWEKVMDQSNNGGGLARGGSGAASANILAFQGDAGQSGALGGANSGWPGSPHPGDINPIRSGVQSDVLHTIAQPIGTGDAFKKGSLEPAKPTAVAPKMKLRCPYCRSWFARTKARFLCSSCKHCHGTRVYRDPFKGDHMLTSAFDQHNQLVQSLAHDALPKLEGPLWWLAADADGQLVLHATLSDPGSSKLAGVIGIRVWTFENEVPSGFPRQGAVTPQGRRNKHSAMPMPLGGSSLPGHQVQITVMQAYRITMQSVLRASGCCPRKLNPEEPWSWLLGNFIQQHRIPTPSVHLCWLQWYLQEDIRSLLPEALELIRNKLDVLRASHLDGFERTQLDALQLDSLRLVEFAFQRYYRLDASGERGLCDRAARSCERCPAALKPAVSLAHLVKDLTHPQDQGWLRALICDAASNRFKHLEAGSGLRGGASIVQHARAAGLKKGAPGSSSWDDLARLVSGNLTQGVTNQKKAQPPALMQEDSWARPPGQHGHAEWAAWLDKHRLDKDHLTVSLATLCDLVKRELEGDLAIHRAHVLPASVILPVVTAEVYCKALSTLITFVLERVRPDPTASSTATVVAIAKLENYLRKNIFGAFSREQPFSAHNLLESTVQRWVDGDRKELLEQLRATCQSLGRHGPGASAPAPGCELQEAITPALRNRLKPYEPIVTHLPLTSTLVEKFATDVIRAAMMESCRIQGVARRGGRGPRYHGGNTGVDVAANMRRDGWTWSHPAKEAVRGGAGLRRCEIVMLNSFRRLLSNIATLNSDIGRWAGAENLPQPNNNTRINMFAGRAPGGPPTGINEPSCLVAKKLCLKGEGVLKLAVSYDERSNVTQADLYASPSMAGGRARMGTPTGSHVSDYPVAVGEKPGPFSDAGSRVPGSPVKGAPPSPPGAQGPLPIGGHSGEPGLTPYGVNFAQLNQEVRHIYSFAVIETAKRVADNVLRESGGMQRIVDSAASTITSNYHAPYAVGPAHGDARVTSAQRLHDGMLALLTGTRRVLEDKAFVALARGIWDHIGAVAQTAIENLHNGAEDPRAWRTQQGIEQMLADLEDFFKQGLQSFVQDSSLVQRDLQAPARFAAARALVSSNMGSNSFQPI